MTKSESLLQLIHPDLTERLWLGTALYDSPELMQRAVASSSTQVVTISLRRAVSQVDDHGPFDHHEFWHWLKSFQNSRRFLLPNTAGCRTATEAITLANMARDLFNTRWVKLEVIGHEDNLQPHPFELVEAAKELCKQGFKVFPYCTEDVVLCESLLAVGCDILMPWGAPIGTGKGLINPYGLSKLRHYFPKTPLVVDAGIGKPSHAAAAMELGYDAVLINSAVARSLDPVSMAKGFKAAVEGGRMGYEAGLMQEQFEAKPSTPTLGQPFWHQV